MSTRPAFPARSPVAVNAVVFGTSSTTPLLPDIEIVPVASGAGSGLSVTVVPAASWTR